MRRSQWNRLARDFDSEICDITTNDRKRVIPSLVDAILAQGPAPRLVDLGCGHGSFIRAFGSRFQHIIGIDFSSTALDQARRRCRGLSQVTWLCRDARRVALPARQRGDVTVSLNLITWRRRRDRTLLFEALARCTKVNGRTLIVVPSLESAGHVAQTVSTDPKSTSLSKESRSTGVVRRDFAQQKHFEATEIEDELRSVRLIPQQTRKVWYPWADEGIVDAHFGRTELPWDWAVVATKGSG